MVIYEGYENFDCDRSNMVMLVMLAMMVGATLCLHRVIVMQKQCYAVVLVMIILIGVIS